MSAAPKVPIQSVEWHPDIPSPNVCRARVAKLTPRQLEVLQLRARGWPISAIARRLGIQQKTAFSHLDFAFETLGVRPLVPALAVLARAAEATETVLEVVPVVDLPAPAPAAEPQPGAMRVLQHRRSA